MKYLVALFSRQWLWVTLLVSIILIGFVRLGFWQFDRLEQRRATNARVITQMQSTPLELSGSALQSDLTDMEYRPVIVIGRYDFDNQVALRNQDYHMLLGAHLLTPLKIEGSDLAVIVDRGWIPQESFLTGNWDGYDEPGTVKLRGVIRLSENKPQIGSVRDPIPSGGDPSLRGWHLANVAAISQQIPYPLLPVYIQKSPDLQNPTPVNPNPFTMTVPYPVDPPLDLTEGNHLSYALQWFTFAIILLVGYPVFVIRQGRK